MLTPEREQEIELLLTPGAIFRSEAYRDALRDQRTEILRLRETTAFWREIEDRLREVHSEMPAAPKKAGDGQ